MGFHSGKSFLRASYQSYPSEEQFRHHALFDGLNKWGKSLNCEL